MKTKRFWAGVLYVALSCAIWSAPVVGQESHAGPIIGHIDGLRFELDGYLIWGWACQQGRKESIAVHLYADDSLMFAGQTGVDSESAVNRGCQDSQGGKHRFVIRIPGSALATYQGKKLSVYGIRIAGDVKNAALAGSGTITLPEPAVFP